MTDAAANTAAETATAATNTGTAAETAASTASTETSAAAATAETGADATTEAGTETDKTAATEQKADAGAAAEGDTDAGKTDGEGEKTEGAAEEGKEAATEEKAVEQKWADDWREKMAGGNKEKLKLLARFSSPETVLDSYIAQRTRISNGDYKLVLPENPTEAQLAEFRKNNGIPENSEGYEIALGDGQVIGDSDKPLVAEFTKAMHGVNAPTETVNAALRAYYSIVDAENARQSDADRNRRIETNDALTAEWGKEFRANINMQDALLDQHLTKEQKAELRTARLPDGTILGDSLFMNKLLTTLAREINPVAAIMPNGGSLQAITDELNALTAKMGDRSSDYWKGPTAEANQARYRELVSASSRLK